MPTVCILMPNTLDERPTQGKSSLLLRLQVIIFSLKRKIIFTIYSLLPVEAGSSSEDSSDNAWNPNSEDGVESENSAENQTLVTVVPAPKRRGKGTKSNFAGYATSFASGPLSSAPKPILAVAQSSILCSEHSHVNTSGGTFPYAQSSQCIALERLQIEYTAMGFLCRICKGFIRPKDFLCHLKPNKSHPHLYSIRKAQDRSTLSNHILSAYCVPEAAVFPLPEEVAQPIDGLSFDPAHQCPEPGCDYWATAKPKTLRQKLRDHYGVGSKSVALQWHGVPLPSIPLTFQYVIRPYRHVSKIDPDYQRVIKLPKSWTPTQPSIQHSLTSSSSREPSDPDRVSAPFAPFLQELGWMEFVESLQCPSQTLQWIAQSPLRKQYDSIEPRDRPFYISLCSLCRLVPGYLLDGNRYAFSLSSDVRSCLTFSYVPFRFLGTIRLIMPG